MTPLEQERVDARIAVLRLARPAVRNAMDSALLAALEAAMAALAADHELSVLVFSTTDVRALCAGADVSEPLTAEQGQARMEAFGRFYAAVEAFPVPTVAVAVGNCVGAGAELVAGVDLRVAGDTLKLAWAGARLGVPVGPARLVPLVGESAAKSLILTGRVLGMEEADRLGLLHLQALVALRRRSFGQAGTRRLDILLADLRETAPPHSELERRFAELCDREGLPAPSRNVTAAGFEVDALWPAARLVVELDGFSFHRTRAAFERDRERDAALTLAGFRVLRITFRRLQREPRAVAETLRSLLADR